VDEAVLAELTTATAVPRYEAARRLRLAAAPRRHAGLRSRLAAGTVSLLHATMIAEACRHLESTGGTGDTGGAVEEVVEEVTRRVLAPLPDGSRPTHALVRSRLARIVKRLRAPAGAGAARRGALARRCLDVMLTEDGMGILTLQLGAEHAVAISDRIEELARAMRQAGDPRGLDQLRADLAAEALLRHGYGPCPTHATPEPCAADPTTDEPAAHDADGVDDVPVGDAERPCGCAPTAPPAWRTLTGREYVSYPKSWTEALHDPDAPEHTPPTRHANAARQERHDREATDRRFG
jgi:hypothetical protein